MYRQLFSFEFEEAWWIVDEACALLSCDESETRAYEGLGRDYAATAL